MKGIPLSIANGIRRSIIADVKTFAARTKPYKESTIEIIKNDSPLSNQIISHRISLIPFHITYENFPIDDYEFFIYVTNTENSMRNITTNDIKIMDLKKGEYLKKEDSNKIIRKDPL